MKLPEVALRSIPAAALSAMVLLTAAGRSSTEPADSVAVNYSEPTVTRTMFTRAHPPEDMPKLTGSESALTQSKFLCGAAVDYEVVRETVFADHVHVIARIHTVKLRISLNDTIYLPQMSPVLLRAHEEGHREMNEQVYRTGPAVARSAAAKLLGRDWEGDGPDVESAGKAATDAAVNAMCSQYMELTARRASRLGDIYDKITDHGLSPVLVSNAIRLSYEQEKKEAATRPATQP